MDSTGMTLEVINARVVLCVLFALALKFPSAILYLHFQSL